MPPIAFLDTPPEGARLICHLHVTADPGSARLALAEGARRAGGDAVVGFRAGPAPGLASAFVVRRAFPPRPCRQARGCR